MRGFILTDRQKQRLYHAAIELTGQVAEPIGVTNFHFMSLYYYAGRDGLPLLDPDLHPLVKSAFDRLQTPPPPKGTQLPSWAADICTESQAAAMSLAIVAEQQTNPLPVIIIGAVVAVHSLDTAVELVGSVWHDVRAHNRGDANANWNPLDRDFSSPLAKFVYRPIVTTAAKPFVKDDAKAELIGEVGGDLLKLTVSVASGAALGLAKAPTVMSGGMNAAAAVVSTHGQAAAVKNAASMTMVAKKATEGLKWYGRAKSLYKYGFELPEDYNAFVAQIDGAQREKTQQVTAISKSLVAQGQVTNDRSWLRRASMDRNRPPIWAQPGHRPEDKATGLSQIGRDIQDARTVLGEIMRLRKTKEALSGVDPELLKLFREGLPLAKNMAAALERGDRKTADQLQPRLQAITDRLLARGEKLGYFSESEVRQAAADLASRLQPQDLAEVRGFLDDFDDFLNVPVSP